MAEAPSSDAAKLQVTYSSYLEMLLSLDLLHHPQTRGVLHPWVVRLKEKVPRRFHDDISEFGETLGDWLPMARLGLRLNEGALTATGTLQALETLPDGEFRRLLSEHPDEVSATRLDSLSLATWRRRLMHFLNEYWTSIFREEFYWIEPLLQRSVQETRQRAARGGIVDLIEDLFKGSIDLDPADFESISVFPSVFGTPDNVVDLWDGRLSLVFEVSPSAGVRQRDELAPPEVLSRMLKSLGDESRLKIMKLILDRRRCTQELAAELELSEPTVSKHLKILREAELLTAEKEGNFVYYSLRLERVAELQMRLLDFLRS